MFENIVIDKQILGKDIIYRLLCQKSSLQEAKIMTDTIIIKYLIFFI